MTDRSVKVVANRLRALLRAAAKPSKAEAMRSYMRSAMPYLGVQTTPLRQICKRGLVGFGFESEALWRGLVLELWRKARYREERYAAINVLEDKRALAFQTPKTLKLYEELIVDGAWWDFVDVIASHRVGYLLQRYPTTLRRRMLAWSKSTNIWKRRTAILCQLSFKDQTDLDLLYRCIAPSLASKEFFLQKAIGWALRQYAWTNPREVRRYVKEYGRELSSLSKREALKNI